MALLFRNVHSSISDTDLLWITPPYTHPPGEPDVEAPIGFMAAIPGPPRASLLTNVQRRTEAVPPLKIVPPKASVPSIGTPGADDAGVPPVALFWIKLHRVSVSEPFSTQIAPPRAGVGAPKPFAAKTRFEAKVQSVATTSPETL
jgi:hypothetical protein